MHIRIFVLFKMISENRDPEQEELGEPACAPDTISHYQNSATAFVRLCNVNNFQSAGESSGKPRAGKYLFSRQHH
jgi:hypothetical protein